jgi:hypothetical protein
MILAKVEFAKYFRKDRYFSDSTSYLGRKWSLEKNEPAFGYLAMTN